MKRLLPAVLACTSIAAGCGGGINTSTSSPSAVTSPTVGALASVPTIFDGSGSSSPNGQITYWDWTFGDGSTGSGKTVQHAYATQGNFNAQLKVTDNVGATATQAIAVTVSPVSAIGGNWSVVGSPATALCTNGGYYVAFPANVLSVLVGSSSISATPSGTGTKMLGAFQSDGRLLVNGTSHTTSYSCTYSGMPANLQTEQEALSATFNGPHSFSGTYTLILNWDILFCNCTQTFQATGSK